MTLGLFGLQAFAQDGTGLGPPIRLSLADAVDIGVAQNTALTNQRIARVAQEFQLRVAEDKFNPDLDLGFSVDARRASGQQTAGDSTLSTGTADITDSAGFTPKVTLNVETGGQFVFEAPVRTSRTDGSKRSYTTEVGFTFTQPLLRGAGYDIATASVRQARIQDRVDILALAQTAISTVNAVIQQYRALQLAQRQVIIARQSLEQVQRQFETNQALIAAGRMAEVDNIQTEQSIASQEVSVVATENAADQARLVLLQTLNLPSDILIDPIEPLRIEQVAIDGERSQELAFQFRTDWQSILLNLKAAQITLLLASNNLLPSLDVELGARSGPSGFDLGQTMGALFEGKPAWNIGLRLTLPTIGDLTPYQAEASAKVSVIQTLNNIDQLRQTIRAEIVNAIRTVRLQWQQYQLASRARELAEQQLAIEQEKLNFGRTTNFQVLSFQTTLTNARNSELSAIVNYQNALTDLDATLGTTLETWNIGLR